MHIGFWSEKNVLKYINLKGKVDSLSKVSSLGISTFYEVLKDAEKLNFVLNIFSQIENKIKNL